MEIIAQPSGGSHDEVLAAKIKRNLLLLKHKSVLLLNRVKLFGFDEAMEEYDQRKLTIFNQLNFFQLLTGILIPVACLFNSKSLPAGAWIVACLPALVSVLVLYLNKIQQHDAGILLYFLLYPFVTCILYMYGMNLGISLFFILYGILSVFFLKDIGYMIFSLCFSMVSYFLLAVVIKHYVYELQILNYSLYLFNHGVAIVFIFYGLYLIKKENAEYHIHILSKNADLHEKNEYIQRQADKIQQNAALLKNQAAELGELNTLKNKLFSVISHDLKAPMYALRNLFRNVDENNMSAEELKESVPDVLNDLNYTVGLMDNLLQWAKAQMQADAIYPQNIDIKKSINEVLQLLHLQAKSKQIKITNNTKPGIYGYIDNDMISLVLRNLLSNAIKFTPEKGTIAIGVHEHKSFIEIYVKDSGRGISTEALHKINGNDFYTTRGTASESGTGLGLMLCKEFLARNGSLLHIESEPGTGSTFSFSVPKCA
jgi:two-component system, sensor histidine kinase and response regulator